MGSSTGAGACWPSRRGWSTRRWAGPRSMRPTPGSRSMPRPARAAGMGINDRKLVAVAPGSKWASKIWSETRYAEVVNRLIKDFGCYPVIFGGSEDRKKGKRLITGWETGMNAAGILSIRESAALLKDCTLYLGNDTGTMHLAAAVGTPCVAIFAAIDWRGRWQPFGNVHSIFRKSVECEGCFTANCFNNHKCLDLIEIDEVHAACARILTTH